MTNTTGEGRSRLHFAKGSTEELREMKRELGAEDAKLRALLAQGMADRIEREDARESGAMPTRLEVFLGWARLRGFDVDSEEAGGLLRVLGVDPTAR